MIKIRLDSLFCAAGLLLSVATSACSGNATTGADEHGGLEKKSADVVSGILHRSGRQLLDASGAPFIVRGAEMVVGPSYGPGAGRPGGVTDVIASVGANAFRPNKYVSLSNPQIAAIIDRIGAVGMVPYVTFDEGLDRFDDPGIKAAIQARPNLVIDALLEVDGQPTADVIENWLADAKAAISRLRGAGYQNVLSIHSVQQGRNLREVLVHGQELEDFDPLHNILMGCQMYWPLRDDGGFEWNEEQGFGRGEEGIREAFREIADSSFPIQLGFATGDENQRPSPNDLLLTLAAENDVGWLWWDWTGVGGENQDSLSDDGTAENLTAAGHLVIEDHPDGFSSAELAQE